MKFHLQTPAGHNLFSGHGAGFVAVNGVRYAKSIVVTPERIVEDWPATDFDNLGAQHFERLLEFKPAIVLLGTGATLRFPHPELSRCLHAAQIGLEVMDNSAVCRTYNILTAEGRNVIAAVLLGAEVTASLDVSHRLEMSDDAASQRVKFVAAFE